MTSWWNLTFFYHVVPHQTLSWELLVWSSGYKKVLFGYKYVAWNVIQLVWNELITVLCVSAPLYLTSSHPSCGNLCLTEDYRGELTWTQCCSSLILWSSYFFLFLYTDSSSDPQEDQNYTQRRRRVINQLELLKELLTDYWVNEVNQIKGNSPGFSFILGVKMVRCREKDILLQSVKGSRWRKAAYNRLWLMFILIIHLSVIIFFWLTDESFCQYTSEKSHNFPQTTTTTSKLLQIDSFLEQNNILIIRLNWPYTKQH